MTSPAPVDGLPFATLAARVAALAGPLSAGDRAFLERAVAALFAALPDGHACLPLATLVDDTPADAVPALVQRLVAAGAVRRPGDTAVTPLVLDEHDALWLHRHFAAELRIAQALDRRARAVLEPPAATLQALATLAQPALDWQSVAVAAALRRRLCVITGGPGTGKTTAIARLVQTLLQGEPQLRCAFAAPTGKATARMAQALQQSLPGTALPRPTTLHRLLDYLPDEDRFRRTARAPLPLDLLVVDEASMVDLELMDALLQALPETARLVLLGDRDQLGSVATGQVFGDLCHAVDPGAGAGPDLAAFCARHLRCTGLPTADQGPLGECVVALRRSWRFAADSGLGAFAQALRGRDTQAARAALQGGGDLRWSPAAPPREVLAPFAPQLLHQVQAGSPAEALQRLAALRILCATRHGPFGKAALDHAVESLLHAHGHDCQPGTDYAGRPILVTSNDYSSQLYNGDLGVLWPDASGRLLAWFAGAGTAAPRSFLPQRLPPHETAWAMTVHKCQGSEFDEVVVVLPDRPGPLLHAALVYTAVTRARQRATVIADAELLAQALANWPTRSSGLRARLGQGPSAAPAPS